MVEVEVVDEVEEVIPAFVPSMVPPDVAVNVVDCDDGEAITTPPVLDQDPKLYPEGVLP